MLTLASTGMMWGGIEATLPSGTTHDWNPTNLADAIVINVTADALGSSIGGIADTTADRLLILRPVFGSLQVLHQDASATAAYRIITIQGATVTLSSYLPMVLIYDATSARWRQIGNGI